MTNNKFLSYENKLLVLLSFILGFVFFDRNALSYLVPFFDKELELNNTKIGLLNSMLALAWAISGWLAGYWSDRNATRKKYLLIAIAVFSTCSFLSGIAASFGWLLIFRMIMGAAEGPVIPLSQSIILANSNENRRGFNMGFVQLFVTNILLTIAPLLMVTVATRYGWRAGFFIAGMPGLILAGIGYFFIKEIPPASKSIPTRMDKKNVILSNPNVQKCILLGSFMMIWIASQVSFLPKYLVVTKHFSPGDMGIVMTCLGIGGIFWGIVLPLLSDKFGRKPVTIFASLAGIIMPLGIILSGNSIIQVIAVLMAGSSILGALPIALTIIPSESIPRAFVAQTMGLVVGIAELAGGFIAPATAGLAADSFGLSAVFYIAAVAAIGACIISFLLNETAPMSLDKNQPQFGNIRDY